MCRLSIDLVKRTALPLAQPNFRRTHSHILEVQYGFQSDREIRDGWKYARKRAVARAIRLGFPAIYRLAKKVPISIHALKQTQTIVNHCRIKCCMRLWHITQWNEYTFAFQLTNWAQTKSKLSNNSKNTWRNAHWRNGEEKIILRNKSLLVFSIWILTNMGSNVTWKPWRLITVVWIRLDVCVCCMCSVLFFPSKFLSFGDRSQIDRCFSVRRFSVPYPSKFLFRIHICRWMNIQTNIKYKIEYEP